LSEPLRARPAGRPPAPRPDPAAASRAPGA
jgi:hypothetical protein